NGLVGNEVPRISGQQAREIADEFMDVATTPRSAVLFLEDNRLMFEVDLRSESGTRYMIYINAVTGGVSRMSRFDDVAFAEPVAQPAQNVAAVPTPSPQPTPASTPSPTWSPSPTSSPSPTWSPSPSPSGSSSSGSRPQNTSISLTRAREIAEADLARRGISASFHSNSGMSWERGQWVWELEFRSGRRVIEYYINVDTGNIVKFEWDD
ncbi:MAG: PepSY domain-containing protein, partial [Defluviitaleaceae bacterium]|nr:PepSY domain-containing protein [Defluviitaleaceae bacterium]